MTDLSDAAAWWASRGAKVFPCAAPDPNAPEGTKERKGKYPLTARGLYDATSDPDEARAMFLGRPGRMVGLRTGQDSGMVVIDTDPPDGEDNLIELQTQLGDLPPTLTYSTPRGGRHRVFRSWPGSSSSAGKLGPHIDVRGEGGYVIVPPSPGYKILDAEPPAELPQAYKDLIARRPSPELVDEPITFDGPPEELDKGDRYVGSVLDKSMARLKAMQAAATSNGEGYVGEPWDATVYAECCSLLELANSPWNTLDRETALNAILDNAPRDAGFGEEQITDKWKSAEKKIGRRGRPKPRFFDGKGIFDEDDEDADDPEADQRPRIDPNTFFDNRTGLRTALLAQAVIDMGPIAIDNTPARGLWLYEAGVYHYEPKVVSDRTARLLGDRFRSGFVATVTAPIEDALRQRGAIIRCEPTPDLINTRSGMVDWRTGQVQPHHPRHYSTVQLPVEWQPEATCPNFDRFLAQVMAPDALDYIWEIIGYLVMSGNPLQKAILFHGEGQNGKGTLLRVIEALLGGHNVSSVTLKDIAEGKFEVASLYGRIANLAGDIDASYLKSTARFKAITGEDTIDAQRKFQHGFSFRCWAVPVFSANRFWKSADATKGYQRRWVLVPFPQVLENPIPGLSNQLIRELPGILVKSVEALRRLMERGNFDPPPSAKRAHAAFDVASDQVREWLDDDAAIVHADPADSGVWSISAEVYRAYRSWAEAYGVGVISMPEFKGRLETMGYRFRKVSTTRILGMRVDLSRRHAVTVPDSLEGMLV